MQECEDTSSQVHKNIRKQRCEDVIKSIISNMCVSSRLHVG